MKNSHGIEMTPEELEEYEKSFTDIEESIELVMTTGEEL